MEEMEIRHCADASAAARAAAEYIAGCARARLRSAPTFTLALSGGSTPGLMLRELARLDVPWQGIHVFQVDERIAPAGDAARNIAMVTGALVVPGLLARENLHPMPVEMDDLHAAARDYQSRLANFAGSPPVLDLVHLGLGDDGHTASLVPGDAALELRHGPVALTGEYRGHRRMTLTYPTLDGAVTRLWLATGADKAPMLSRLAAGDASIPAGRVRRDASVVFTDRPSPGSNADHPAKVG